MKSLIIGMGIGQLYKNVLTNLGHEVVTVDSDITKGADFSDAVAAVMARGPFDTAHICTPNFTHSVIATRIAHECDIIFIEKPGVATASNWATLVHSFPDTRFMMVKNNMWRSNIDELKILAEKSSNVELMWINKDRVPNPGTWFTTKKLAFGGVSRDLMPHLLSLYIALNPDWLNESMSANKSGRKWELSDLTTTDYGVVKANGVYDVDDYCNISFGDKWNLQADWRSNNTDARKIEFVLTEGSREVFELGLCPEDAYERMIKDAIENKDNKEFWNKQLLIDFWIHERMENF